MSISIVELNKEGKLRKAKSRRNRHITESEGRIQELALRLERLAYAGEKDLFAKKVDELRRDLEARMQSLMESVSDLKFAIKREGSENPLIEEIDKLMEGMKEHEGPFIARVEKLKLLPVKVGTDISPRFKEYDHLKDEIDRYFAEASRAVNYLVLEYEKQLLERISSMVKQIVEEEMRKLIEKATDIKAQAEKVNANRRTIEDLNDTIDFIKDRGIELIAEADKLKLLLDKGVEDKEFKVAELNRFLGEETNFYREANNLIEHSLNELRPVIKARDLRIKLSTALILVIPILSTLFIYNDLGLRQELQSFELVKFVAWILTGMVSITLFLIFFVLSLKLTINQFIRINSKQSKVLYMQVYSIFFAVFSIILTLICDHILPNFVYPLMFLLIKNVIEINPAFVVLTNIATIITIGIPCLSAIFWLYKISKKQMSKILERKNV